MDKPHNSISKSLSERTSTFKSLDFMLKLALTLYT